MTHLVRGTPDWPSDELACDLHKLNRTVSPAGITQRKQSMLARKRSLHNARFRDQKDQEKVERIPLPYGLDPILDENPRGCPDTNRVANASYSASIHSESLLALVPES